LEDGIPSIHAAPTRCLLPSSSSTSEELCWAHQRKESDRDKHASSMWMKRGNCCFLWFGVEKESYILTKGLVDPSRCEWGSPEQHTRASKEFLKKGMHLLPPFNICLRGSTPRKEGRMHKQTNKRVQLPTTDIQAMYVSILSISNDLRSRRKKKSSPHSSHSF